MVKKFEIGGMSCSMCVGAVEKAVKNIDGVNFVSVSLISKSLSVVCNDKVKDEDIISAVGRAGYTAKVSDGKKHDNSDEKRLKKRFLISLVFLLPLLYFSMGKMAGLPVFNEKVNLSVQAILALTVILINLKFYIGGVKAVINKSPNMDTLVSLGSFSAYIYSFVMTVAVFFGFELNSPVFFESSAMVLTIVTLGKWLEEISKGKTGAEIDKLMGLIPETATVLVDGKEMTVAISDIKAGDVLIIRAGEYIPVDGKVQSGNGFTDNSAITGESLPVEVFENSNIVSGSILKNGYIQVVAENVGNNTVFSKIIERIKMAGESKAPVQRFADAVSKVFVPIVCVLSVVAFISWIIATKSFYNAFKYAICVLVVSCPCSLGLATPVAVMAATGKSASVGVLFKNAESMQNSAKINCVLFDKTATLTTGEPKVTGYVNYSENDNSFNFSVASALEKKSGHPLSDPIREFCGETDKKVDNYEYIIGKGIVGEIDGKKYYLGNFKTPPNNKDFFGKTVITLSDGIDLICAFAVSDILKSDSATTVKSLNSMGVKTVMITGDGEESAKAVAEDSGIQEYKAEVLPEGKATIVEEYGKKGYYTCFVGDGINDSPALKTADIGIAVGTGTDIAIESADIVLASNLNGIIDAVAISKKANSVIKGNLFWALFYNVLLIPVAGGVFSFINFTLTPSIASICMSISSLFVVINALRINGYKREKKKTMKGKDFMRIKVEGMMCKHCESRVYDAITGVNGVVKAEVNHKKGVALVYGNPDPEKIKKEIENAGYKVFGIEY